MYPRLVARARHAAAEGFAAASIELPGSGDRPRSAAAERARADLRRAVAAGEPVDEEIVDRLVLPLVERAVASRCTTTPDRAGTLREPPSDTGKPSMRG